jgi:hypothetical protein
MRSSWDIDALPHSVYTEVRAAIAERERWLKREREAPPRRRRDGFADLRRADREDYAEAAAARRAEDQDKLQSLRYQITKMSNLISNIDPAAEIDMENAGGERMVVKVYEALLRQTIWLERVMPFFERHLTDLDVRRLIKKMDQREGRNEHENAIIDAKIAHLRKKLTHRLEFGEETG